MGRTIAIQGSDEVMTMFGKSGTFYRGKWENVKVTGVSHDEEVPLKIRTSLVELVIPTIFTKESIEGQTGADFSLPDESRLAYCLNVVKVLNAAKKHDSAEQLNNLCPHPLDMYVLEKGIYELV